MNRDDSTKRSPAQGDTPQAVRERGNRLKTEPSLYLRQHAHNPVDWQPFDEQAIQAAKRENKPIFLSIGYSSCHWCHVMENEVFEHDDVAEIMNRDFISIKVDREERPDLDEVYMSATVALTGGGGWPMSVFLTPSLKPFFAGTYIPRDAFKTLLLRVHEVFVTRRAEVEGQAENLVRHLSPALEQGKTGLPGVEAVSRALRMMEPLWDVRHGGLGGTNKFPSPRLWLAALHEWRKRPTPSLERMLHQVLESMSTGGLRDHLGGGFHRYTVEPSWMIPHFEKMLYDNAQLALLYTEAFAAFGTALYEETARETLDFLLRDMRLASGGFAASLDADSGGEEGSYYVWTPEEFSSLLGERDGLLLADLLGVTETGNFEGKNVLSRRSSLANIAARHSQSPSECLTIWERHRPTLLNARARRTPPARDDKAVTAWNALAVHALLKGFAVLGETRFRDAAISALDFLKRHHTEADGSLLRASTNGPAQHRAMLTDYANLVEALFASFQITGRVEDLSWGLDLLETARRRFADAHFVFASSEPDPALPFAPRSDLHDGVRPSGPATMTAVLLQAFAITGRQSYLDDAQRCLAVHGKRLEESGLDSARFLDALRYYHSPRFEIVLVAGEDTEAFHNLHRRLLAQDDPDVVLVPLTDPTQYEDLVRAAPSVRSKEALSGKTTAYVCRHGACLRPVHSFEEVLRQLDGSVAVSGESAP